MTGRLGLTSLFLWMLREEWRMHSHLFGGRRFAAFPLLVTALVALGTAALHVADTALTSIVFGLTLFAVFFGLHTGSVGLVSRDAVRDLLGDTTLLIYTGRTLPVDRRSLVAVFVIKDVAYYAALFLTPIAAGVVAGSLLAGQAVGATTAALLWVTLTLAFVLGVTVTLAGIAVATRGVPGELLFLGGLALAGGLWWRGVNVLAIGPYGVYAAPTPLHVAGNLAVVAALALVGIYGYRETASGSTTRDRARYRRWRRLLPFDDAGLTAKMLLEVRRSDGGFLKAAFSGGIVFGVTAYLAGLVASITGVAPSTGLTYGGMLALTAFTTYNWLTVTDDLATYTFYPVDVDAVFRAKYRAFLVLGAPVALGYYALAAALWSGPPRELAVGAVVLLGVGQYLYGLTVYLTGFRPNEFLFDTVKFTVFTLGVALVLVPILIVGFAIPVIRPIHLGIVGGIAVLAGASGFALYRRAIARWAA